jgi:endonuclease VIII
VHRAALRIRVLVGDRVAVQAVHPRARSFGVAERLDGRVLESVEARGKNLFLGFEGGLVLRSHLRMSGGWSVVRSDEEPRGRPWLVLRGRERQAVLRGGSVLELTSRAAGRLGPDILAEPPDFRAMVANLRRADRRREIGEALLDQRLVAGIGNVWRAEALWRARLSPWRQLGETNEAEVLEVLRQAESCMRASLAGERVERTVYRRVGRPCTRCGTPIAARGQGDDNRVAYWCPMCQPTEMQPAPVSAGRTRGEESSGE